MRNIDIYIEYCCNTVDCYVKLRNIEFHGGFIGVLHVPLQKMNSENAVAKWQEMGARIAEEREYLRLTQQQLADKIGLSREMWGRYERGLNQLSEKNIRLFVELGADETYLRHGGERRMGGPISKGEIANAIATLTDAFDESNHARTPAERAVLLGFRGATPDRQRLVLELLRAMSVAA